MDTSLVSAIADSVTALVAVAAGWFGIGEYRRAGRWKAAELAAAHLQQLGTDERLAFACRALDWGVGPIPVPAMYQTMAGMQTVDHSVEMLKSSLTPDLDLSSLTKRELLVYRHCFDHLFGFLDSAQELLDLGLVDTNHFKGLRYWLKHLAEWSYAEDAGRTVFIPFLVTFGYGRVLRLFQTLEVPCEFPAELDVQGRALIAKERP